MAAVPARLRALLAEIGDQRAHLTFVRRHERQNALDALDLGAFAAVEARCHRLDEGGPVIGGCEHRIALARLGRLQLDEALILEVAKRGDDPRALLSELPG